MEVAYSVTPMELHHPNSLFNIRIQSTHLMYDNSYLTIFTMLPVDLCRTEKLKALRSDYNQ
jgi:hypothetical protein